MEKWKPQSQESIDKAEEIRTWLEANNYHVNGASEHFKLTRIQIWRYINYLKEHGFERPPHAWRYNNLKAYYGRT